MAADTNDYYVKGITVPETPEPGEKPKSWGKTEVIGQARPRIDGYERVSGSALYPSDLALPDMLYGAILRCPHPNAKIKAIDVSSAEKLPGVRALISQKDKWADLPWGFSRRGPDSKLFELHCRFEGEAVAAVAAETPYQAWDAVRAIRVDYELLPFVADERRALEPGAPLVQPDGNQVRTPSVYTRGDVEKGFQESEAVLEAKYRTDCEMQTPMELHGCVAKWDGDELTIWESSQGVYAVQSQVAQVLKLPLAKVRVIGHYMGGGFGSKLQTGKYSIIASILAKITARPVKMFLSREETFLVAGNRPAANMTVKAGAKKDGTLTALSLSVLGSAGAYPGSGTGLVDWLFKDLYTCPNVKTESTDVFISAGRARPFRAPGHPQGAWALEQMVDSLAEAVGMDPVEFRLKNIPAFSQARRGNPPYTTSGLRDCLVEGAKAFGWAEARQKNKEFNKKGHLKRGVGVASALWIGGAGGPPSTVIIKVFSDGSANLNMGASDIGTGTKTIMAMVMAEELGLKPDMICIENADTGTTQYATPSGGSKTVPTESPAVRDAAIQVKQQLLKMGAEELGLPVSDLTLRGGAVTSINDPDKRIEINDISTLRKRGVVVGIGYRGPNPKDKAISPFAAQFCEVEVNTLTGEVRLLRFLGAHESGRVMDRLTFDNQVYGGITMGIGLAMTEFRVLDKGQTGKLVNKNWHDYKLPTALDVAAETISVPIDMPDAEANITGAKGLGEPVTIPTAAAVANAVYDAVGVRVTETPINPISMIRLMSGQQTGGR